MFDRNFRPDPQMGYSVDEELFYLSTQNNTPQEGEDGDYAGYEEWLDRLENKRAEIAHLHRIFVKNWLLNIGPPKCTKS